MAVVNENCFDICLKITVSTRNGRRRAKTEVQSEDACTGIDFEFENGDFIITLPLVACVRTTLRDNLSADAQLISLSLPGYF